MILEISLRSERDEPVSLTEIAKVTGISRNYLEQLAVLLKTQSLLRGFSGRKGGDQLAKPAREIKVLDVVKATMGPIHLTQCISHPESCTRSNLCESRMLWLLINLQMNSVLATYSLADLTDEDQLASIAREIQRIYRDEKQPVDDKGVREAVASGPERTVEAPRMLRHPDASFPGNGTAAGQIRGTAMFQSASRLEKSDYLEVLGWLEEELQARVGTENVRIPVDRENAKLVYTTNLREIKYTPLSLLAAAEIFYAAGENWTMVTEGWDSHDLFNSFLDENVSNYNGTRVFSTARKLKAQKIVLMRPDRSGLRQKTRLRLTHLSLWRASSAPCWIMCGPEGSGWTPSGMPSPSPTTIRVSLADITGPQRNLAFSS
jgi:Rrf2 family protein